MGYNERIVSKLNFIFDIYNQYSREKISLDRAKEQIHQELFNIRPTQLDAIRKELAKRLKDKDQSEIKKVLSLFSNYLPFPFLNLEEGHPLRTYCEENNKLLNCLIKIDKAEGQDLSIYQWKEIYNLLEEYIIHIERQNNNFYSVLSNKVNILQIKKAGDLGNNIILSIRKNKNLLKENNLIDFLFYQRNLVIDLMNYISLEERVIFPSAYKNLLAKDFIKLKRLDDKRGYAYIKPGSFTPKLQVTSGKKKIESETNIPPLSLGMLLPSLLDVKDMGVIYYNLSGEIFFTLGKTLNHEDLEISQDIIHYLIEKKETKENILQKDQDSIITISIIKDQQDNPQGILKTKQDIRRINAIQAEHGFNKDIVDKIKKTIDGEKNIGELFDEFPMFQKDIFNLDEEMKGLKNPQGIEMLKESTIDMLAKALGLNERQLVDKINELLGKYPS